MTLTQRGSVGVQSTATPPKAEPDKNAIMKRLSACLDHERGDDGIRR